jgi:LysR family transcriptional activator of nhaA
MSAVKQRPGNRALRLNVGVTDALSKLIAFEILKPAFCFADPVHIVCRQAEIGPLVNQLQAHRLDIVLADEPASSSLKAKTFNHRLGRSGVTFCAVPAIAVKLRRNFPRSLHGAPALLPSENMGMRGALEKCSMRKDAPAPGRGVRGFGANGSRCPRRARFHHGAYGRRSRGAKTLWPQSHRES